MTITDPQILYLASVVKTLAGMAVIMAFREGYSDWSSHIPQSTRIFHGLWHVLALIIAGFITALVLGPVSLGELL